MNALESGERVLWTGQPGQGIRFRRADRWAVPFTLLWMGFFVVWESWAARDGRWVKVAWVVVSAPNFLGGEFPAGESGHELIADRISHLVKHRRLIVKGDKFFLAEDGKTTGEGTFKIVEVMGKVRKTNCYCRCKG